MNASSNTERHDFGRALTAMDDATVRSLLESLSTYRIEVVKEPETGLVMMNVSDCFDTDFHLGEILVTTAEVSVNGKRGWGMIMGDNGDRALLLACLDVVLEERTMPIRQEIEAELKRWLAIADGDIVEEQKRAAATRVSFQSMASE